MHNQTFVQSIRRSLSSLLDPNLADTITFAPGTDVALVPIALSLSQHPKDLDNLKGRIVPMPNEAAAVGFAPEAFQSAMLRLSRQARLSGNEPDIVEAVIRELVKAFNLTGCQISLYNSDGSKVTRHYQYIPGTDVDPVDRVRGIDFPQQVRLYAYPEITQFCPWIPPEDQALTVLFCPLADHIGLLGEVTLSRRQPDAFAQGEMEAIELMLDPCLQALRRSRLFQATQAQAVELKRLGQVQDNFLGTISYELRVPLSSIKMAIQMITLALTKEESVTQLLLSAEATEKVLRYLDVLQRECDRETKLIQDLLDLQQLDTDTLSLVMASISVADWLPYVVAPLQKRALEAHLTLDYEIDPDLPPLMCDQISLSRIVTELLTNACKFTPQGEQVRLRVGQNETGDRLVFSISNSGVEIPLEERDRIFDKFYRLPKLDLRQQGGTGLGLALVQKLVSRLDGSIGLKSDRASGTCFTVELPLQGV